MKTLILILVLFSTLNLLSNDYIFQTENEKTLISYAEKTKLQFFDDKIKYELNNEIFEIEFRNENNEILKLVKPINFQKVNYYYEDLKFEDIVVYSNINYGDISINIDNYLNINLNNKNNIKVFLNGKEINNKQDKLLVNNSILKIESEQSIEYELGFSTIIGGKGYDLSGSSEKDEYGNLYFSGFTTSNLQNWIRDAYQVDIKGSLDYFVVKLDSNDKVVWGTYIGSPSLDGSCYLDVKDGMIWVAGESHGNGFPLGRNAVQTRHSGNGDFSIFRLNYDGKFEYGTYNGGNGYDTVIDVKIDDKGIAWITGRTCSESGMHVTRNAFNKRSQGDCDGFLMGFDRNNNCIYSSYYGGESSDLAETICITNNYIIMGGYSESTNLPNPLTRGLTSSFIFGINRNSYEVDWSFKYPGKGFTTVQSLHSLNNSENTFYVSGYTDSNLSMGDVFQSELNGKIDMFISKFDENGTMLFTTLLGGNSDEGRMTTDFQGGGITNDDENNIYVSGYTKSTNFPITKNAFQKRKNNGQDAFLTVFDSNLKNLKYSTFLGGKGDETGRDVIWSNNSIYINGWTNSSDFPLTRNALQRTISGQYTAFITKFSIDPQPDTTKPVEDICNDNFIEYNNFTNIDGISLINNAFKYDSTIQLTNNKNYQKGAIWIENPVEVSKGFTCKFTFELSNGDNRGYNDKSIEGAEGIAFVIQGEGNRVIGFDGGGIGYEGIENSLAIEIDLFNNNESIYNDPNGNHVAVFASRSYISSNHKSNDLIAQNIDVDNIYSDKRKYNFKVNYNHDDNYLRIYLNDDDVDETLVLEINDFYLENYIDFVSENEAFVGVTASTGFSVQTQELTSFSYCGGIEEEDDIIVQNNYVYPNPANSFIYIDNELVDSQIKIYDMIGNPISFIQYDNKLDISNFKTGVYLISFDNNSKVQRFVVE